MWDEGDLVGEGTKVGDCGTVLVADRDPLFRAVVEGLLERWHCHVLAASTAEDALALAASQPPSLAIVCVELPGVGGLTVLRELHERFGEELPVILVSSDHGDAFDRTAGLLVGAEDYLVKPVEEGELAARLRRSLRRAGAMVNGESKIVVAPTSEANLSRREREILALLAAGSSQKEIATALVLSSKTVGTHIQHVLSKLGVHSRAEAVAAAYRRGLVDVDVTAHLLDAALVAD